MSRLLFPLFVAMILAGCTGEDWRTQDVSDVLPPLDFQLVNESGKTVTEQDYAGKATLLFFGYTHCPDVCPTTLARLRAILQQLDSSLRDRIQVLFVSVDPKRDTSESLSIYTDAFGPEFIGLTGTKAQIDDIANRYRVSYSYDESDESGNYNVSHSSAVLAFDDQGHPTFMAIQSEPNEAVKADVTKLAKMVGKH